MKKCYLTVSWNDEQILEEVAKAWCGFYNDDSNPNPVPNRRLRLMKNLLCLNGSWIDVSHSLHKVGFNSIHRSFL